MLSFLSFFRRSSTEEGDATKTEEGPNNNGTNIRPELSVTDDRLEPSVSNTQTQTQARIHLTQQIDALKEATSTTTDSYLSTINTDTDTDTDTDLDTADIRTQLKTDKTKTKSSWSMSINANLCALNPFGSCVCRDFADVDFLRKRRNRKHPNNEGASNTTHSQQQQQHRSHSHIGEGPDVSNNSHNRRNRTHNRANDSVNNNNNTNNTNNNNDAWPKTDGLLRMELSEADIVLLFENRNEEWTQALPSANHDTMFVSHYCNQSVIVKRLQNRSRNKMILKKEIEIHFSLQRHGIPVVGLIGYYFDSKQLIIVYEFARNGDLFDTLEHTLSNQLWLASRVIQMQYNLYEIAKAIYRMHYELYMAHKDLSLENILINEKGEFMLHDFGDCEVFVPKITDLESHTQTQTQVAHTTGEYLTESIEFGMSDAWAGKEIYMSPENYETSHKKRKQFNAFMNDVWSFGVILLSCFTDGILWESPNAENSDYNARIGNLRTELEIAFQLNVVNHNKTVKSQLNMLIDLLLRIFVSEDKRLNMRQVLESPFWDGAREYERMRLQQQLLGLNVNNNNHSNSFNNNNSNNGINGHNNGNNILNPSPFLSNPTLLTQNNIENVMDIAKVSEPSHVSHMSQLSQRSLASGVSHYSQRKRKISFSSLESDNENNNNINDNHAYHDSDAYYSEQDGNFLNTPYSIGRASSDRSVQSTHSAPESISHNFKKIAFL